MRTRWNLRSRPPRKRAMLGLTRKLMEKIYIGDGICVTVGRPAGGQVRPGIAAPREVAVVRAELVPEGAGGRPNNAVRPPMGIRTDVRTRPAGAHGIGNRRPGRSR